MDSVNPSGISKTPKIAPKQKHGFPVINHRSFAANINAFIDLDLAPLLRQANVEAHIFEFMFIYGSYLNAEMHLKHLGPINHMTSLLDAHMSVPHYIFSLLILA